MALIGIAMALASGWVLIPILFAAAVSVLRTVLEDKVLMVELDGYREYAQRVRYKLVPFVF